MLMDGIRINAYIYIFLNLLILPFRNGSYLTVFISPRSLQ